MIIPGRRHRLLLPTHRLMRAGATDDAPTDPPSPLTDHRSPSTDYPPALTEPDHSCIHCGGRTNAIDPVCLRCRSTAPYR